MLLSGKDSEGLNLARAVDESIMMGKYFSRNLAHVANELGDSEKVMSLMHEKLQKEIEVIYRRAKSPVPLSVIIDDLQRFVAELRGFQESIIIKKIKDDITPLIARIEQFIQEYPRIRKDLGEKTDRILLAFITSMKKILEDTLFKDFNRELGDLERIRNMLLHVAY